MNSTKYWFYDNIYVYRNAKVRDHCHNTIE